MVFIYCFEFYWKETQNMLDDDSLKCGVGEEGDLVVILCADFRGNIRGYCIWSDGDRRMPHPSHRSPRNWNAIFKLSSKKSNDIQHLKYHSTRNLSSTPVRSSRNTLSFLIRLHFAYLVVAYIVDLQDENHMALMPIVERNNERNRKCWFSVHFNQKPFTQHWHTNCRVSHVHLGGFISLIKGDKSINGRANAMTNHRFDNNPLSFVGRQ